MVDGSEEGTMEMVRALARALERLFFRWLLLFPEEIGFVFCVGFSVSILELRRMHGEE